MYKVTKQFVDLTDDNHVYHVDDEYPREGYQPSEARLNSLLTGNNRQGIALIVKVEEKVESLTSAIPVQQQDEYPVAEQEASPKKRRKKQTT